jgi:hypothetical protein
MKKIFLFLTIAALGFLNLQAQPKTYFVALNGSDSNPGTITLPFATIPAAVTAAVAGDTIFVRGGTYNLSAKISLGTKSGASNSSKCYLWAYPGEKPLLDFSSIGGTSSDGLSISGTYWYVKGFSINGAPHNGLKISGGNYNVVEFCSFHDGGNTGCQLGGGASYNKIINCDSYYNYDAPTSGGNADGFSPKLDVGTGNYFYGCRSWQNSDDGYDGYLRPSDNVTTTLENCWAFMNGYLKNGNQIITGNGNGFKIGGSDNKNLHHNFILRNCLSFDNRVKGFDQNNNLGSMTLYNCTGFRNGTYNFSIPSNLSAGYTATIKNSVSLLSQGTTLISATVQQNNTWLTGFAVSNADFISVDTTGVRGPRKADGSLPDITFMHLTPTSALIDAGVDVGIPFTGRAPDLGAFEYGMSMYPVGIEKTTNIPSNYKLEQNYPNPFNPSTIIRYQIPASGYVTLKVYDLLGKEVASLIDEYQQAGIYHSTFSILHSTLSSGIYFYQLRAGKFIETKKLILLK